MADCSRLARRQSGKLGRRTSTAAYGAQPETVTKPNEDDVEPRRLPSGRGRRRGTGDQGLSVGLGVHGYKSLRVAVMICDTLVNTQTDRQKAFDR